MVTVYVYYCNECNKVIARSKDIDSCPYCYSMNIEFQNDDEYIDEYWTGYIRSITENLIEDDLDEIKYKIIDEVKNLKYVCREIKDRELKYILTTTINNLDYIVRKNLRIMKENGRDIKWLTKFGEKRLKYHGILPSFFPL